jgi:hypothetical protein
MAIALQSVVFLMNAFDLAIGVICSSRIGRRFAV